MQSFIQLRKAMYVYFQLNNLLNWRDVFNLEDWKAKHKFWIWFLISIVLEKPDWIYFRSDVDRRNFLPVWEFLVFSKFFVVV